MKQVVMLFVLGLLNLSYAEKGKFGRLTSASDKKYIINYDGWQKPGILGVCSPTGTVIGFYCLMDRPDRIAGHRIVFDRYPDVAGNGIAFRDDPPKAIELDNAQVLFQIGKTAAASFPMVGKKLPTIGRKVPDPGKEAAARSGWFPGIGNACWSVSTMAGFLHWPTKPGAKWPGRCRQPAGGRVICRMIGEWSIRFMKGILLEDKNTTCR